MSAFTIAVIHRSLCLKHSFHNAGPPVHCRQHQRCTSARLDGCYVIKTDLPETAASKQVVHDRYKDLTEVEMAFRTSKTVHLELRLVSVRTEDHTRGHVLAVMLRT